MKLYKPFQLFTPEECIQIIKDAKELSESDGIAGGQHNPGVRNNKVFWLDYDNVGKFQSPMLDIDGYDITWIQEPIQISKYDSGQFYHWHKDQLNNQRTSARILTLTCTLQTAPGGLFETRDHTFDLKQGEAVIIPSNVEHRALPPISGTRWAVTAWGMGANPNLEEPVV